MGPAKTGGQFPDASHRTLTAGFLFAMQIPIPLPRPTEHIHALWMLIEFAALLRKILPALFV